MNCMETRALVEDALDETLSGNQKRVLDLHLSRCDGCRAYFAAERNEHRRWFQAMNEPEARRRLPDGFAEEFIARIVADSVGPQKRWTFVRAFRRIAAVLVAILMFAGLSYAAVVAVDELGWVMPRKRFPRCDSRNLPLFLKAVSLQMLRYQMETVHLPHPRCQYHLNSRREVQI